MSTGFDIVITPGEPFAAHPVEFYKRLVSSVLASSNVRRSGIKITAYRNERPSNYGAGTRDPNVIFQTKFDEEESADDVVRIIEGIKEQRIFVGVTFTYDRLKWNRDLCDVEPSAGWLSVEYEAKDFALGHHARLRGTHRIHFDYVNAFNSSLIDTSKCPPVTPEIISRFVKYGANIKFVKDLLKSIVVSTKPANLAVITEGVQLNPAHFHSVYHEQLSDFENDARKMLQLHRDAGGSYEEEFRSAENAKELAAQLDLYAAVLTGGDVHLSDEEILDVVTSCSDVEPEMISEDSLLITHSSFLFGYLDVLYKALLDRLAAKSVAG